MVGGLLGAQKTPVCYEEAELRVTCPRESEKLYYYLCSDTFLPIHTLARDLNEDYKNVSQDDGKIS